MSIENKLISDNVNIIGEEKVLSTQEIEDLKYRLEKATKEKFKEYDRAKRESWQKAKYIIID